MTSATIAELRMQSAAAVAAATMANDAPPTDWNDDARSGPRGRPIRTVDATAIAAPLPALAYLVERLGIASGAPALFAGYGFGGKTMALQSMALSVASGKPVWGAFFVRRGRALHLDWEQGSRVSHERYQRLARGMGIDLAELGDRLRLAVSPEVSLEDADALDSYRRAFEGVDFAVVDSLRAAAGRVDENSSEIRRYIDLLNRAAEPHGTTVAIVHHARKPKADDPEGDRYKIRGSSALYDACGSVFVLSADKGQATRVSHEKCRNRGVLADGFGLRVEDVEGEGDPRWGLRVAHLDGAELAAANDVDAPDVMTKPMRRVHAYLVEQCAGDFRGAKGSLCARMRMGRTMLFGALAELESQGFVEIGKDEQGHYVRAVPNRPVRSGTFGDDGDSTVPSQPLGGRTVPYDEGGPQ